LKGEVIFVGAGPGAPDLITVAGLRAIESADVVLYAGSLVNPALLEYAPAGIPIHNTASMNLEETTKVCIEHASRGERVVRLHTGDPSLYGAIQEQMVPLDEAQIPYRVIPGVSSAFASAAALKTQLTLPGVSQTVIFTRLSGRTPVPEGESLEKLAASGATLCVFLSVDRIGEVVERCLEGGRSPKTPAAVVSRAGWPDESSVSGTLEDIAAKVKEAGFVKQSMIIVGDPLGPRILGSDFEPSKLYAATFTHGYRKGSG